MKSDYQKSWRVVPALAALLVLHVTVGGSVYGSEPLPPGYRIFDLYTSGKLTEARKALREYVQGFEGIKTREIRFSSDAEGLLGGGVAASVVMRCINLERECNPGGRIPDEVYESADIVRKGTDEGFAAFERVPADIRAKVHRPEELKAFSVKAKADLLKLELAELRRDGREDRLQEILAEEAGFLKTNSIKADHLLSGGPVPSTTTPAAPAPVKLNGRQLAIVQLLLTYYAALSAEDASALDRVLLPGPNLKTGKDIVADIAQERDAEQDFDSIGPVVFDDESGLMIVEKTPDELHVTAQKVNKSFRLGEKIFTQREADRFVVRIADGQYRLVIPQKGEER